MARSKQILDKVKLKLGWNNSNPFDEKSMIYSALNQIQLRICEKGGEQYKFSLSLTGTELYNFPDGFFSLESILPSSTTSLKKISIEELTEIKRRGSGVTTTSTEPMYYYLFNNQIGFINSSGGASGSGTVYLYGWKRPKDDGTEDISDSVEPILDRRWDICLELGAIMLLRGAGDDYEKYENEYAIQRQAEGLSKQTSFTIQNNTDYD